MMPDVGGKKHLGRIKLSKAGSGRMQTFWLIRHLLRQVSQQDRQPPHCPPHLPFPQ